MFTRSRFRLISVSSISHRFTASDRQNTTIRAARQPSPEFFWIGDRSVGASSRGGRPQASSRIAPSSIVVREIGEAAVASASVPCQTRMPGSDSSLWYESEVASTVMTFCYNRRCAPIDSLSGTVWRDGRGLGERDGPNRRSIRRPDVADLGGLER